jgi:hypothetical protein
VLHYRELVTDVVERTGSTFDEARTATEAAVTALVQMLPSYQARELLDAVPAALLRDHVVEQTSGQPGSTCHRTSASSPYRHRSAVAPSTRTATSPR